MKDIKLIYSENCPNYKWVKELILRLGIHFEEVDQNNISENHPLRYYTSPSVLNNNELIFGAKTDTPMGACSFSFPSEPELIEKLKNYTSADKGKN